jgi:hypothetical protein
MTRRGQASRRAVSSGRQAVTCLLSVGPSSVVHRALSSVRWHERGFIISEGKMSLRKSLGTTPAMLAANRGRRQEIDRTGRPCQQGSGSTEPLKRGSRLPVIGSSGLLIQ